MRRRALITGITGQDGSYLAELLLGKGYEVHGLVREMPRPAEQSAPPGLILHRGDLRDSDTLNAAVRAAEPDEVYNLAAVSRVSRSWQGGVAGAEVNALGAARLLGAVATERPEARFFQASSSEMLPGSGGVPQDEATPLRSRSPYGAEKAYAHHLVAIHRDRGLFACAGILFNHESPRRPRDFVSRRITRGAAAIKLGLATELSLGNLDARRDWGYAPEYMEAAWLMLQAEAPEDFVLGSGRHHSVAELVELAFAEVELDATQHLRRDPAAARPADLEFALADPTKARERLGWTARTGLPEIVREMVAADLADLEAERSRG